MSRYISFRDFDWMLFIFVLLICGLGVMEIHSATLHTKFAGAHIRQIYWVTGGVVGMFLVSLVNYQKLLDRVHWLYIAAIVSLMTVMLFGQKYLGARRWVKMPGGRTLSAFGVGEADPDSGGGEILLPTCTRESCPGRISPRRARLSLFPCSWSCGSPTWEPA